MSRELALIGTICMLAACAGDDDERGRNSPVVETPAMSQDIAMARFSPDSTRRVYAGIDTIDDIAVTSFWIEDLRTGNRTLLLPADSVTRYTTFEVSPVSMEWNRPDLIRVLLSDGDVDLVELELDPVARRLIRASLIGPTQRTHSPTGG